MLVSPHCRYERQVLSNLLAAGACVWGSYNKHSRVQFNTAGY